MSKKDLETLIDEALINIRSDRKVAREFLNEIANQIAKDAEQNKYLSPVAAKHIETLQRSNEQLVKLIGLRQKGQKQTVGLTEEDKITLINEVQEADYHNLVWNGLNENGQSVASGRYILKMTAPGYAETITMTLLK